MQFNFDLISSNGISFHLMSISSKYSRYPISRVSDFLEKSIIVSYDLSSHIKSFNFFVSSHVQININPVAIGSSVQLCQIFFSHNSLLRARMTSKLLIHFGLSTAISMFTVNDKYLFLFILLTLYCKCL